jgi:hypothetical protein
VQKDAVLHATWDPVCVGGGWDHARRIYVQYNHAAYTWQLKTKTLQYKHMEANTEKANSKIMLRCRTVKCLVLKVSESNII